MMHLLSCLVIVLLSIIYLSSCTTTTPIAIIEDESIIDGEDIINGESIIDGPEDNSSLPLPSSTESIFENINIINETTLTTIIIEEPVKQFLTEYLLNGNLSLSLPDEVTFYANRNETIVIIFKQNGLLFINKNDQTIEKHFQHAILVSVKQQQSDYIIIFDDNTQNLWIFDSNGQHVSSIKFKPTQIHIFSPTLWIAETTGESALYITRDAGVTWTSIENSGTSSVLGWSNITDALVIRQHSNQVKLLDLKSSQITLILNDVSSVELFTRYLLARRLTSDDSITIHHVNHIVAGEYRSLPVRLQSHGSLYCATEDVNTKDLLLLFVETPESNETTLSTCSLVGYSRQNQFHLSNVTCHSIGNETNIGSVRCSNENPFFYQVHGLPSGVFLANIEPGPVTVVSFDGGATWNKTRYECSQTKNCSNKLTIVIGSLWSCPKLPGIVLGRVTDGVNEYVAISSDGGRLWRVGSQSSNQLTAVSNPNALVLAVSNGSLQYTTDYGRTWHQQTYSNKTSKVLSLIVDDNNPNSFNLLTINNEDNLIMFHLDFNILIPQQCARRQLKEWSLSGPCINGSKLYYKRRMSGSHCFESLVEARLESCACSLIDFDCSPGYKRSADGTCLLRPRFLSSASDCTCNGNATLSNTKRGYVKSTSSQCANGMETYVDDAYVFQRNANLPTLFIYGVDSRTKVATAHIHTSDFDRDDEDEDEDTSRNTIWQIDPAYEITALVFNETSKQVFIAVEHNNFAIIYRIGKNFRQSYQHNSQLIFEANNELYKSNDERIEYLGIDWLTQNLYVLARNKKSSTQNLFILDTRTRKRRTIGKKLHIHPTIFVVDPLKTKLYWLTHNSPSILIVANLQGEIEQKINLDSNVTYFSYNPISHELILVINANVFALNTLQPRAPPRLIYEHSSSMSNLLFAQPILYFTDEDTNASSIRLNAIDVVAKSLAKNIATFKNWNQLKLFVNMAPIMPTTSAAIKDNQCAIGHPCPDLCIPLAQGRFRCLCSDDARYQVCSCPIDERFIAGTCQAKNDQCAPGRVLCQNRVHCAESGLICEQDHTQYTESFKNSARCTLDSPNDGFDCYFSTTGIIDNSSCIPFEWLCDGTRDCPLGNDEEHCHKMTTTKRPVVPSVTRCLTNDQFTHVMCRNKCVSIGVLCRDLSNAAHCSNAFHLNCQATNDRDQYICKCRDEQERCIAMVEQCDELSHCERICNDSVRNANTKSSGPSASTWTILVIGVIVLAILVILVLSFSYYRRRQRAKKIPIPIRAPPVAESPPSDAHEKLLNNSAPIVTETSN